MGFKGLSTSILATLAVFATTMVPAKAESLQIVGLGDSLMASYQLQTEQGFPAQLQAALKAAGHDVSIIDAGVSGDTTAGGLARLDWSVPDGTDGVILELGANDALRGLQTAQTAANLDAILARLKERGIPVLLAGMLAPPNMGGGYGADFNAIFPELATRYGLTLYPFFLDGVTGNAALELDDGMHPNPEGIKVMVEKFLPVAESFVETLEPQ